MGKDVLKNLSTIVASLDAVVLKELKLAVIQTVLSNVDVVFFGNMTEEEFNEDVKALGFMRVDAYKVFGHLKVTFQDGNVTLGESDDFTVENIDQSRTLYQRYEKYDRAARCPAPVAAGPYLA